MKKANKTREKEKEILTELDNYLFEKEIHRKRRRNQKLKDKNRYENKNRDYY